METALEPEPETACEETGRRRAEQILDRSGVQGRKHQPDGLASTIAGEPDGPCGCDRAGPDRSFLVLDILDGRCRGSHPALLLGALLGAWLLTGTARAFCLGFALFGIVFFVLVEWDWVGGQFGHDLTSGLVDLAESLIARPVIATPARDTGTPIVVSSETLAARDSGRQLRTNQSHGSVACLCDGGRLPRQDLQRSPARSARARRVRGFLTMRWDPEGMSPQ